MTTFLQGFEAFQKQIDSSELSALDFVSAAFRGDLGAVGIFVEAARGKLLYEKTAGNWFYYDATKHLWCADPTQSHVLELTGKLWDECQAFVERTGDKLPAPARDAIQNWMKKLSSNSGRTGMQRMAQGERTIWTTEEKWDANPYLLHFPNGVYDVETTEFREARPEDYLTRQTSAFYDPTAKCPLWEKTLLEIFSGRADVIEYFQRAIGYTALGLANGAAEQKMFLCFGPMGSNGKNTVMDTIAELLGSYAGTAANDSFNQSKEIPEDVHNMRQCRMIIASEPDRRSQMNEEMIKALTGNREMRTRQLYENSIVWTPRFCIWMLANHYPRVPNSHSLFRRFVVFPFMESFSGARKIFGLGKKLVDTEASGILNWVIAGARNWLKDNLEVRVPDVIRNAHKEFLDSTDIIRSFCEECLSVVEDCKAKTEAASVFVTYRRYCEDNGYYALGRNRFYSELLTYGVESRTLTTGRIFTNIELKQKGTLPI